MRPLSLPSAQACATGEKLKCAQPQPQEADPLQVQNPSHSCHLSIYLHLPIYLSGYLSTWLSIHRADIYLIDLLKLSNYLANYLSTWLTISTYQSIRLAIYLALPG